MKIFRVNYPPTPEAMGWASGEDHVETKEEDWEFEELQVVDME